MGDLWTEVYSVEKDTVIQSNTYKKLKGYTMSYFFREDLDSGKVWKITPECPQEVLVMDYNLKKGDTFDLVQRVGQRPGLIDSVYIENGRKHFLSKGLGLPGTINEYLILMEGIGSNYGLGFKDCMGGQTSLYLLCVEDSGRNVFANRYFQGECYPEDFPILQVQDVEEAKLSLYPNPAAEVVHIQFDKPIREVAYRITDIYGRTVQTEIIPGSVQAFRIQVGEFLPGTYIIFIDQDGKTNFRYFNKN